MMEQDHNEHTDAAAADAPSSSDTKIIIARKAHADAEKKHTDHAKDEAVNQAQQQQKKKKLAQQSSSTVSSVPGATIIKFLSPGVCIVDRDGFVNVNLLHAPPSEGYSPADPSASIAKVLKNAKAYRKKFQVRAFQVDSPCIIDKSWGQSSCRAGGYVVVGQGSDAYCVEKDEFERLYDPVPSAKGSDESTGMYRKSGSIWAIRVQDKDMGVAHSVFHVRGTDDIIHSGSSGDFLVQEDKKGAKWVIDADTFLDTYEPVRQEDQSKSKALRLRMQMQQQEMEFQMSAKREKQRMTKVIGQEKMRREKAERARTLAITSNKALEYRVEKLKASEAALKDQIEELEATNAETKKKLTIMEHNYRSTHTNLVELRSMHNDTLSELEHIEQKHNKRQAKIAEEHSRSLAAQSARADEFKRRFSALQSASADLRLEIADLKEACRKGEAKYIAEKMSHHSDIDRISETLKAANVKVIELERSRERAESDWNGKSERHNSTIQRMQSMVDGLEAEKRSLTDEKFKLEEYASQWDSLLQAKESEIGRCQRELADSRKKCTMYNLVLRRFSITLYVKLHKAKRVLFACRSRAARMFLRMRHEGARFSSDQRTEASTSSDDELHWDVLRRGGKIRDSCNYRLPLGKSSDELEDILVMVNEGVDALHDNVTHWHDTSASFFKRTVVLAREMRARDEALQTQKSAASQNVEENMMTMESQCRLYEKRIARLQDQVDDLTEKLGHALANRNVKVIAGHVLREAEQKRQDTQRQKRTSYHLRALPTAVQHPTQWDNRTSVPPPLRSSRKPSMSEAGAQRSFYSLRRREKLEKAHPRGDDAAAAVVRIRPSPSSRDISASSAYSNRVFSSPHLAPLPSADADGYYSIRRKPTSRVAKLDSDQHPRESQEKIYAPSRVPAGRHAPVPDAATPRVIVLGQEKKKRPGRSVTLRSDPRYEALRSIVGQDI